MRCAEPQVVVVTIGELGASANSDGNAASTGARGLAATIALAGDSLPGNASTAATAFGADGPHPVRMRSQRTPSPRGSAEGKLSPRSQRWVSAGNQAVSSSSPAIGSSTLPRGRSDGAPKSVCGDLRRSDGSRERSASADADLTCGDRGNNGARTPPSEDRSRGERRPQGGTSVGTPLRSGRRSPRDRAGDVASPRDERKVSTASPRNRRGSEVAIPDGHATPKGCGDPSRTPDGGGRSQRDSLDFCVASLDLIAAVSPKGTTDGDRRQSQDEAQELRATLDKEFAERCRLEAKHETVMKRISESEAQASKLHAELQEVRNHRDALRRQLREKTDRQAEVVKKMKTEQETKRSLDAELAKVEAGNRELEAKIRSEQLQKVVADTSVSELQQKLLQLEQDLVDAASGAVAVAAARKAAASAAEMVQPAVKPRPPEDFVDATHGAVAAAIANNVAARASNGTFVGAGSTIAEAAPSATESFPLAAKPTSPEHPPTSAANLESQLEQLRRQLEDTVRVVQNRRGSFTTVAPSGAAVAGDATDATTAGLSGGGKARTGGDDVDWDSGDINAMASAEKAGKTTARASSTASAGLGGGMQSPAALSLLETTSPCSSLEVMGIAAASTDAEENAGSEEEEELELPAEDSLVSAARGPDATEVLESSPTASRTAADGTPQSAKRGGGLSLRDLSEIKTLKKPPPPVRMLMEICCMLFHISPVRQVDERNCKKWCNDYWEPARRYLLSDPFFPSKLRLYDAETLSAALRAKIKKYFRDPEFTAERVRTCSKAAFELYQWVRDVVDQEPIAPRAASSLVDNTSWPSADPGCVRRQSDTSPKRARGDAANEATAA